MVISNDTNMMDQQHGVQNSAVLHRDLHHDFLEVARGEGNHLILKDGRKVFDASGGAAVACVGVSFAPFSSVFVKAVALLLSLGS